MTVYYMLFVCSLNSKCNLIVKMNGDWWLYRWKGTIGSIYDTRSLSPLFTFGCVWYGDHSYSKSPCHLSSYLFISNDQFIISWHSFLWCIQCESKKSPPRVFWKFFPNGCEFLINFLHTYFAIISKLDYKFLFKYLQLWQSYAILSATT